MCIASRVCLTQFSIVTLAAAMMAVPSTSQAAAPAACVSDEHHQFDFWLGDWKVFTPDGKPAGSSHIERIIDGCAILENWTGTGGVTGKSLNMYDASDRQWHQFWVDSSGSRLLLDGSYANGRMVLKSDSADPQKPGALVTQRITWSTNADGSIRQLWETTRDIGKTWSIEFDGKYVRAQQ
jgi:hypothetical protein